MAITTITAAVDMPAGTAAHRIGPFRAASVSPIVMVHGTMHLIIGTGTDNQLKAARRRPSFSLFFSAPLILLRLARYRWRIFASLAATRPGRSKQISVSKKQGLIGLASV